MVSICQAALFKVGHYETLPDGFEDNPQSKAASLCALLYPQARRSMLRLFPWTCAKTRAELTANSWTANNEYQAGAMIVSGPFGLYYGAVFRTESGGRSGQAAPNWAQTGAIADGTVTWTREYYIAAQLPGRNLTAYSNAYPIPVDFVKQVDVLKNGQKVAFSLESSIVYTDTDSPVFVYIKDEQNTEAWDPILAEAITMQLAGLLAYPLTGSHENEVAMGQAAQALVIQGAIQSQREQRQGPKQYDPWVADLFPEIKE